MSEKYEAIQASATGRFVCAVAVEAATSMRSIVLWRQCESTSLSIANSCYCAPHDASANGSKVISIDLVHDEGELTLITCTRRTIVKHLFDVSSHVVLLQSVCEYSAAAGSIVSYAKVIDSGRLVLVEGNRVTTRCMHDNLRVVSEVAIAPSPSSSCKVSVVDIACVYGSDSSAAFYVVTRDDGMLQIWCEGISRCRLKYDLRASVSAVSASASADEQRRATSSASIDLFVCDSDSKITYFEIDIVDGPFVEGVEDTLVRRVSAFDFAGAVRDKDGPGAPSSSSGGRGLCQVSGGCEIKAGGDCVIQRILLLNNDPFPDQTSHQLVAASSAGVFFLSMTAGRAMQIAASFDQRGGAVDCLSLYSARAGEGGGGEAGALGVGVAWLSAFDFRAHQRILFLPSSSSSSSSSACAAAHSDPNPNPNPNPCYSFLSNKFLLPEEGDVAARGILRLRAPSSRPPGARMSVSRARSRFDWNTPTVSKDGDVLDKPVTFHTKVKSSGYGQSAVMPKTTRRRSSSSSIPGGAVTGGGKSIRKYDISDASRISSLSHQASNDIDCIRHPISSICFSGDAAHLVVCGGSVLSAFPLPVSRNPSRGINFIGHDADIHSVSCSNDKQMILSTSADHTARIFKVGKGDSSSGVGVVFSHYLHNTAAREASNKGGGSRNKPFVHDLAPARFFYQDRFVLLACKGDVLLYSYDCASGESKENDLVRFRTTGSYSLLHRWTVPNAHAVTALGSVNSVGSGLVVASTSAKQLVLLDACSGRVLTTLEGCHEKAPHHIELPSPSPHAQLPTEAYNLFLTAAIDECINIWDIRTPRVVARYCDHVNRREKIKCSFSPCMRYIGTGSEDKTARIVDLRTLRDLAKVSGYHKDVVTDVKFSPLFPQVATASFDGTVRFFSHCSSGGSAACGDTDYSSYYAHFMG